MNRLFGFRGLTGMSFDAEPAKLGIVFASAGTNTNQCPMGTNPSEDTCP